MKKFLSIIIVLLITVGVYAQKDVTTFLGIPVDGTKAAMKSKLIEKGFTYNRELDCFEGEFNGRDVNVSIVTNNNRVYRINIVDSYSSSERDIQIRFNNLCYQFANNKKYVPIDVTKAPFNYIIPDDEDISYGITVKNKRYYAAFCQNINWELVDSIQIQKEVKKIVEDKYSLEELVNLTDSQKSDLYESVYKEVPIRLSENVFNKSVWFCILELHGGYVISMYYDNEYNKANGEDL